MGFKMLIPWKGDLPFFFFIIIFTPILFLLFDGDIVAFKRILICFGRIIFSSYLVMDAETGDRKKNIKKNIYFALSRFTYTLITKENKTYAYTKTIAIFSSYK